MQNQNCYFLSIYKQPASGDWKHGMFDCCDSCTDCLCAWLCAPCYACIASQKVGQNMFCQFIQCCFYPECLCCLRAEARNKQGIDVIIFFSLPQLRLLFLTNFYIKG